jgi:hypothetical protein
MSQDMIIDPDRAQTSRTVPAYETRGSMDLYFRYKFPSADNSYAGADLQQGDSGHSISNSDESSDGKYQALFFILRR